MIGLPGNGKKMATIKRSKKGYEQELMIKQFKVQKENQNPNLKKEEKFSHSSNNSNKKRKAIDKTTTTNNQISPVVQLMKQWVQLHDAAGAEDSDWLNPKKKKRSPAAYDSSCSTSTCWPPRAHYLPHVDTFALPYVIPF